MSHDATNWAIKQRGIKPAAKIVLWHLADRHNKDTGRCDPNQELLAHDCEISRSSLNNQLKILEEHGLIKRENRVNKATNRQENTFYILGFDLEKSQDLDGAVSKNCTRKAVSKKQQKPCPKNDQSRVQILDTYINPVNKPVIEPVKAKRKYQFPADWMPSKSAIEFCREKGFDEDQIGLLAEACVNHHRSKGNTFLDHDLAFKNWANNDIKFNGEPHEQRSKQKQRTGLGDDPFANAVRRLA